MDITNIEEATQWIEDRCSLTFEPKSCTCQMCYEDGTAALRHLLDLARIYPRGKDVVADKALQDFIVIVQKLEKEGR